MENTISILNTDTNIEVAQKLICAETESDVFGMKLHHNFYELDDLEEIAEHLLAYVKAARSRERKDGK